MNETTTEKCHEDENWEKERVCKILRRVSFCYGEETSY